MIRERKLSVVMTIFFVFNLAFCSLFMIVIYYEGLDEVLNNELRIDELVLKAKKYLYYFIIGTLISLIAFQLFVQSHIFYLMCRLHHLEFKRVRMQMFSVVASQIFFYLFAFIFVEEWYGYRFQGHKFFSFWTVECPLNSREVLQVYLFWVL